MTALLGAAAQAPITAAPVTTHLVTAGAHSWHPPTGIATRGTLVVLPGRGEHPLVYERFGHRLAMDGYLVHALATDPDDDTATVLAAADAAGPAPAAPVVLVGSDTGALQALHAAAAADERPSVAGVIVAGTAPTRATAPETTAPGADAAAATDDASWDAELGARTACPTHRRRITEDPGFVRGTLSAPVPTRLLAEALPAVPTLVLHGDADPITPPEQAAELAARLPSATLGLVSGGLHDVLNDASHRTTAATVVLWLEQLRAGPGLSPIITVGKGSTP